MVSPAHRYPHTIDNGGGERLTFLRRTHHDGVERLEVENRVSPGAGPPMHVHYHQEEAITVQEGRLGYQRLGEPPAFAGPGETVTFPPGDAHRFWNAGEDELHCTGYIEPPDNVEYFLGGLFASQQANGGSQPRMFDAAWLSHRYRREFGTMVVPAPVRRFVFPVIVAVGNVLGKDRKFADAPAPRER